MNYIQCDYIEVTQPIGTFYMATMDWKDIIEITYADVRRISNEQRDIEVYLGIQRELSPRRIKELAQYVNLEDATFPSGIILAIESTAEHDPNSPLPDPDFSSEEIRNIRINSATHKLEIRRDKRVAKVIDGQHRIEGLRHYVKDKPFETLVTIFVDMDIEDQAMVFATINKAQTKVNKSIVYDLFDFAQGRSPQKTAHNIAKLLNNREGSPFKDRIKILGVADDPEMETITQATFVESLMTYISRNPMSDRNELKLNHKLPHVVGKELQRLFFRNLFIDEKDAEIARILWNYFSSVRKQWPNSWETKAAGNVLNKSTGFIGLMKFLRPAYLHFNKIGEIVSEQEFETIFKTIGESLSQESFTPDTYKPGATGQTQLYKDLLEKSGLAKEAYQIG